MKLPEWRWICCVHVLLGGETDSQRMSGILSLGSSRKGDRRAFLFLICPALSFSFWALPFPHCVPHWGHCQSRGACTPLGMGWASASPGNSGKANCDPRIENGYSCVIWIAAPELDALVSAIHYSAFPSF